MHVYYASCNGVSKNRFKITEKMLKIAVKLFLNHSNFYFLTSQNLVLTLLNEDWDTKKFKTNTEL